MTRLLNFLGWHRWWRVVLCDIRTGEYAHWKYVSTLDVAESIVRVHESMYVKGASLGLLLPLRAEITTGWRRVKP